MSTGETIPHFEDYHRTVIGYHGTRMSTALKIVQGLRGFKRSRNRDDWLGHGIYFWEHAPQQAWWWANRRRQRQGSDEEIAVLGSMIRLGNCLDLLDPFNVEALRRMHGNYVNEAIRANVLVPENANHRKYLDCAVFEYAYSAWESVGYSVDSSRAVYVPTESKHRIWRRSWIMTQSHIQLCVRSPKAILGTWMLKPSHLEEFEDA